MIDLTAVIVWPVKAVQTSQATKVAVSSLAWAASGDEAAEWARALVALTRKAPNRDGMLAAAIAYPAAGGPATDVLLDAIREKRPDAPAKEAGTEAALAWLAEKFSDVLHSPVCPPPPQLQPGLKCPPSTR
jgi:hypothetical protein